MNGKNSILYIGLCCIIGGVLMGFLAETGRYQAIGGFATGLGIIISIVGALFYAKKPTSSSK